MRILRLSLYHSCKTARGVFANGAPTPALKTGCTESFYVLHVLKVWITAPFVSEGALVGAGEWEPACAGTCPLQSSNQEGETKHSWIKVRLMAHVDTITRRCQI